MKTCPACKKPMPKNRKTCSKACSGKLGKTDLDMLSAPARNMFLKMPTPAKLYAKKQYEENEKFVEANGASLTPQECALYAKKQDRLYRTFYGVV